MNAADQVIAWERSALVRKRARIVAWCAAVAIVLGAVYQCSATETAALEAEIKAQDRTSLQWALLTRHALLERAAIKRQFEDSLAQVRAARPRVAVAIARADSVNRAITFSADTLRKAVAGDTVQYVEARRADDPRTYSIPLFVAEAFAIEHAARDTMTAFAHHLDGTLATSERLLAADSVVIARQDSTIQSQKESIELRDQQRKPPRFGLKTGLAIGVTVTAVLVHLLR